MNKITRWLHAYLKSLRQRRAERQKIAMHRESSKTVQITEFQGELYICYDRIPLINVRYLENVQSVLKEARQVRENYLMVDLGKR